MLRFVVIVFAFVLSVVIYGAFHMTVGEPSHVDCFAYGQAAQHFYENPDDLPPPKPRDHRSASAVASEAYQAARDRCAAAD